VAEYTLAYSSSRLSPSTDAAGNIRNTPVTIRAKSTMTNQNWEGSSARIYHISKKKIHIPLNLVLIPTIVGGEQKDTDVEEIVKSAMYKVQTKGRNKKKMIGILGGE
jgi:hypothetical protein